MYVFALFILLSTSLFLSDSVIIKNEKQDTEIFLLCQVSKQKIYAGEPVKITYKLLYNGTIGEAKIIDEPSFKNYNVDALNLPQKLTKEKYKGKNFKSFIVKQVILTPNTSGTILLDPLRIKVKVEVPSDPNDFFSNETYEELIVQNTLKELTVLPLPTEINSNKFSGAIGKFNIRTQTNEDTVSAGKSLQLKVIIEGKGGANNISPPILDLPENITIYPPVLEIKSERISTGYAYQIIYEYSLLTEETGSLNIPSIPFTYFEPNKTVYNTVYSKPLSVYVKGNSLTDNALSNSALSEVADLNTHPFLIIIDKSLTIVRNKPNFYNSATYYIVIVLQLIFLSGAILYTLYFKKSETHGFLTKKRNAYKNALNNLNKLIKYENKVNDANAPSIVYATLLSYLNDKFSIPENLLTIYSLKQILAPYNLSEKLLNELIKILKECNEASFSLERKRYDRLYVYQAVKNILYSIEKTVK
jgi:hypothetical protein